jgi:vacuolar-type H+-ATPase subunit F/Vma7
MVIDARLINSSSMIVAGPTQAGKTTFVHGLLNSKHLVFTSQPISQIYWICSEIPINKRLDCTYIAGIPEEEGFSFVKHNSIVVIDDLMQEAKDSLHITNLFTKITHHRNCFVIFITQNYFSQSSNEITRRRNCQYVVLFKNPADTSQIHLIASKMFPDNRHFLSKSFKDAVSRSHGYLLLDLRQETLDDLRVRTNILPHELPMIVYKQSICDKKKIYI